MVEFSLVKVGRWSFDDHGIGWASPGARTLDSRTIMRGPGMSLREWYELAGQTVHLMNQGKMQPAEDRK